MLEQNSYPVMTQCADYINQKERWEICRQTIEGEDVVKREGEKYR